MNKVYRLAVLIILLSIMGCPQNTEKRNNTVDLKDSLHNRSQQKAQDTSMVGAVLPGADTFQRGCELVQDQAESLVEEYYLPETNAKRLKEIIIELENLELEWKKMDCQQVFGYMVPEMPRSILPDRLK